MKVLSCYAPYDHGGLGRYLSQVVEEARQCGELEHYFGRGILCGDSSGTIVDPTILRYLFMAPPMRYSLGLKDYLSGYFFDRSVAQQLRNYRSANCFHGFNGKSILSFQEAQRLGFKKFILESANSHAMNVLRQHKAALATCSVEDVWLNSSQSQRMIEEYQFADEIFVASLYSRNSFLDAGIEESKLRYRPLKVKDCYIDAALHHPKDSSSFKALCVGRIDVTKGIAVLRRAFTQFADSHSRLHFVGGTTTRGMSRYMQEWISSDTRVSMGPGDPREHLIDADVIVHPSFEDGFGLAPMEGLFLGVPAIVTADTGMKDYIQHGQNGFITKTGCVEELVGCFEEIRDRPLRGTFAKPIYSEEFPEVTL